MSAYLPTLRGSPDRARMFLTPRAQAPRSSACRARMFLSRVVTCMIGSRPCSIIQTETASGVTLTVAAWLWVTLAAATYGASFAAVARTGSATGSTGGLSSAVTEKVPAASSSRRVILRLFAGAAVMGTVRAHKVLGAAHGHGDKLTLQNS